MERTDEDLMNDKKASRKEVAQIIFKRYKIRIFGFCLRMLGNRADAEEVAGEVFLALLVNRYRDDAKTKFSTWLFTIARNQCVSRLRKRKTELSLWRVSEKNGEEEPWDLPDHKEALSETLNKQEISAYIRKLMDKLPEEQKEAIVLQHYDGFSYEEISRILDCSLDKVKILIFRGKEKLRVELKAFLKEEKR